MSRMVMYWSTSIERTDSPHATMITHTAHTHSVLLMIRISDMQTLRYPELSPRCLSVASLGHITPPDTYHGSSSCREAAIMLLKISVITITS